MVNKKNNKKPSFKEIQNQLKLASKNKEENIIVHSKDSPNSQLFCWRFDSRFINWNYYGWKSLKKTKDFLDNIVLQMYQKYLRLTWYEVKNKGNCGYILNPSKKQKESLKSINRKFKENDLLKKGSDSIYDGIYHIKLTMGHRLFGYRDENDVFWIILNDPDHTYAP